MREEEAPPAPAIRRREVRLRTLPAPDHLDFDLPAGHAVLLTDDGSQLGARLASALRALGRPVVLLTFPETLVAAVPGRELPAGVARVALTAPGDDGVREALERIAAEYGPIGCFVHLHPESAGDPDGLFSTANREIVRSVFFCAKHLAGAFGAAAGGAERRPFAVVTRMDGALGLTGAGFDPLAGGLFGLVKSLAQEWPGAFCRAVDLAPGLAPDRSVELVVAELHDPNRLLVEVGYGAEGRVTPAAT